MKCLAQIALSVCLCAEAQEPSFEQRIADLDAKAALLEKLLKESEPPPLVSFNFQSQPPLEPLQFEPTAPEPIPSLPEPDPVELPPALERLPSVPILAPDPVSSSPSHSQDLNSTRDLSLFQAIGLALNNADNLAFSQARIDAARARLQAIGAMPSPEFRWRHDDSRLAGESTQEYALRFRFNNPWEIQALREEGQARTQAARFRLQSAQRLLSTEVAKMYFETLYRQGDVFYAREIAKAQFAIRSTNEALFIAGQLTLPKTLESRLKASQKASAVFETENAAENAIATLRAYLDLPENQSLNLVTPFTKPDANASTILAENPSALALLGRPELLALESESDAARARVRQVRARHIPWFSFVQASIEHDRRIAADTDQWGVLLGIDVPLWGRRTDLQAAAAELQETLSLQRLARRDLRLALAAARRDYQAATQRLAARETSVSSLERDLAPALWETQDGQGIELVIRQRLLIGLLEARRDLFEARHQRQTARLALETALGYRLEHVPANEN